MTMRITKKQKRRKMRDISATFPAPRSASKMMGPGKRRKRMKRTRTRRTTFLRLHYSGSKDTRWVSRSSRSSRKNSLTAFKALSPDTNSSMGNFTSRPALPHPMREPRKQSGRISCDGRPTPLTQRRMVILCRGKGVRVSLPHFSELLTNFDRLWVRQRHGQTAGLFVCPCQSHGSASPWQPYHNHTSKPTGRSFPHHGVRVRLHERRLGKVDE